MSDDALHDEAVRILRLAGGDAWRAFELLERQFGVLVLRTQVMLSLSGIVITVTGFSGQAVARTGPVAKWSISAGIFVVLVAAAVAIWGVLRLRWITQDLDDDPVETLRRALVVRRRKSRFLAVALVTFVVGFALYCVAIVQLLMAA